MNACASRSRRCRICWPRRPDPHPPAFTQSAQILGCIDVLASARVLQRQRLHLRRICRPPFTPPLPALSPGGYAPEYRDHPTLRGGQHVFKAREGVNLRNEGHSSLSLIGAEGMWKTRLAPGWSWDLGAPGDPGRGVMRDTRLAAGERIAGKARGDWYAALVLDGSVEVGGRQLRRDDVLLAERAAAVPDMIAGSEGVHLLEHFRTARALEEAGER